MGRAACCCAPSRIAHSEDPSSIPHSYSEKRVDRQKEIQTLEQDWAKNPRWKGVKRGYSAADVVRLRGSLKIEHTLAKVGAEKLWKLCHERPFVNSLGALTGNQAMQQVKAGVPAIYL